LTGVTLEYIKTTIFVVKIPPVSVER